MNGQGLGTQGNTTTVLLPANPLPAGQYRLTDTLEFSKQGEPDQQVIVPQGKLITVLVNDAGINGTSTSIGSFGNDTIDNDTTLTKFNIYPADHEYFVKTGDQSPEITEDSSENGITGGRHKLKQRKTRKIPDKRDYKEI